MKKLKTFEHIFSRREKDTVNKQDRYIDPHPEKTEFINNEMKKLENDIFNWYKNVESNYPNLAMENMEIVFNNMLKKVNSNKEVKRKEWYGNPG